MRDREDSVLPNQVPQSQVQVQIIISQVVPMIPIFRLKTGVQIVGGVLAILSGVLLVLFFAKLDEVGATSFLFGHVWKQFK